MRDALVHGGLLQTRLSEDELKQVIDASSLSGTIDKTEHELIKSVLQFSDITAKEIMVPRPDIVALDISPQPGAGERKNYLQCWFPEEGRLQVHARIVFEPDLVHAGWWQSRQ